MADTLQSDAKYEWISAVLGLNLKPGAANADAAPPAGAAAGDAPGSASDGAPGSAPAGAPGGAPGAPGGPAAVQLPATASPNTMNGEDIAAAIMDKQLAILVGWEGALSIFDKTMTSDADADATPDFQKAVVGYFSGKLMSALINHTPGASEVDAFVGALSAEYNRAAAAGASAKLRDFVNDHTKAITKLQQATLAQRQGFISAVKARREAAEAPQPSKGGKKSGKWVLEDATAAQNDYAVLLLVLTDMLASVDRILGVSTTETLFRMLSEEWVRHATVRGGMGTRFQAVVVIRLNPNYTILDAHIQGTGGQKLAEQLLKDSPDGVDVFRLQAPRRILLMAENGWPSAILSLDANNRDTSTGSIAEGNTGALYKYVMSKGLPATKKLSGD